MAISFVGSDTTLVSSGAQNVTMDVPVGAAEGDIIIALVMSSQLADVDCTETGGTYTQLFDLYQDGSANDTNFAGFYKVQGATPDTTVTLKGRTTNGALLGLIAVYRGVDTTTPIDVAVTTAGAADANSPDPPATTTATDGAWVLACAGCSDPDAVSNAPTGYSNLVDVQQTVRNCMISSKEVATAGAEDPGAYTDITGDADDSWCAATVVLRPASSAQSVAAGTASETDSAIAIGKAKAKAIGTTTETDSAQAIRPARLYAVGVASETASAIAISRSKSKAIGVAVETDAAVSIAAVGGGAVVTQPPTYGAAPHTLSPARVRAKYEEIEAIERHIAAKEEAERERVRKQQEAKRQLAELEAKKRQTKTIAERRRKLEARIESYEAEIFDLREAVAAMLDEIEQARAAFEQQQQIADRRRRMLLLIAAAS